MRRLLLALVLIPITASVQAEFQSESIRIQSGASTEQRCDSYRNSSTWHNCTGIKILIDGTYWGEWRNGRRHGSGTLRSKNVEYTGEFRDGELSGVGTRTTSTDGNEITVVCNWETGIGKHCSKFDIQTRDPDDDLVTYEVSGTDCDFAEKDFPDSFHPMDFDCERGTMEGESMKMRYTRLADIPGANMRVKQESVDVDAYTTSTYIGGWKGNQRHGNGTLTGHNGSEYAGQWKNGERHGKGISTSSDGVVYEGDWKNGEQTGTGSIKWPEGATFIGELVDGKRNGKGALKSPDGDIYVGDYVDDKPHGAGSYARPDGWSYVGEFVEGYRAGRGKLTLPEGILYDGIFADTEHVEGPDFRGTVSWSNGDTYIGGATLKSEEDRKADDGYRVYFEGWGGFTPADGTPIQEGVWVDGDYSESLTKTKKGKDFRDGNGVLQNYESAKSLFVLAARGGDEGAMYHLANLYKDQKVVDEPTLADTIAGWFDHSESKSHLIKAHMWANLAGDVGRVLIKTIQKRLDPEEITQAQDFAKACLENDYQGC